VVTAIVLFNRDLRLNDHPALAAAAKADRTVPLFVLDEALKRRGGRLFVRRGDVVGEALALARECGASELHVSADWSAYARARERRLAAACAEQRIEFRAHPGVTIVEPGAVTPGGGDHFKVFTPYHRSWSAAPRRQAHGAPRKLTVPSRLAAGRLPALEKLSGGRVSPRRAPGGEREGRRLMRAFLRDGISAYDERHNDLPGDATSRLSAHLRFGCLSPLELAREAERRPGGGPFVRQLCWRDFHHQVLAAEGFMHNGRG
jgi:deoxyribodipyrimidine photo-lyase